MIHNLHRDDAMAVDLLLQDGVNFEHAAGAQLADSAVNRVALVDSILRVFGEMPAPEPPADLVQKTMIRVNVSMLAHNSSAAARPFNS